MSFARGDRVSIFGALRPREGQILSRAVVTTYSLDLVALLGLALALGGEAEAEFDATPFGLVHAFEKVKGKLLVMHQAGRLVAPAGQRTILPLLDTMIHAVHADERYESWHPKLVLARYEGADGVEWRFWIGSRNLTGTTDLDAGLLLVSGRQVGARPIPTLAALVADLLSPAGWSAGERAELELARWRAPPGVTVRRLLWRKPGERTSFLAEPRFSRPERLCAVTPFLNRTGIAAVRAATPAPLTILSTRRAGSDCAPIDGVTFRMMSPPEPAAPVALATQQGEPEAEFSDPPATGIHAKLLMAMRGDKASLILGSANLTSRGLLGPNAEAVAVLDVDDPALAGSLSGFVDAGMELFVEAPDAEHEAREKEERALDAIVSAFLERGLSLHADANGLILTVAGGVDDLLADASLFGATFPHPERQVEWAAGVPSVRLLDAPPPPSEQTPLVILCAQSRRDPTVRRSWAQRAELPGFDAERRDHALLARYIGASRFRAWLRSLLDGIEGTGGGRWSDPPSRAPGQPPPGSALLDLFTLETMLAKWARDPDAFEAKLPGMIAMLSAFEEAFQSLEDEDEKSAALAELAEVAPFLQALANAVPAAGA
jgi:hypothetical protein